MAAVSLQSTSRDSLGSAEETLDRVAGGLSAQDLSTLGGELYSVLRLLESERTLLRHLADSTVPEESRTGLARALFENKIGPAAYEVVTDLVGSRWSRPSDVLYVLETLARRALLGVAEADGELDDVEDELFRFGRVLDREPELNSLLTDPSGPVDKRVELLDTVLADKARPTTRALLEQAVRSPRGRALDLAANDLAVLAAARRDRYVARVRTAVGLSQEQEQRLAETLTRMYGRQMSLQVELDESLIGGLAVEVGGELIDGSVAGRLAAAQRKLPH
ncbi:F0F1 ATP synthase subunit delta [Pseudonocardia endophytica]|uniref:ATP synthase subunit delta n=1 Tax=Pseudonocardia endophytica TaxID=401976 RepID=A0A4R1HIM3_PSEEN|nr:F0F1 ATP synthase subunit delta [Pseudonocardia endophytica]TCK20723.1 F-type H+-transporting ATPase subunit delta [Pseudonocardia endophytica]